MPRKSIPPCNQTRHGWWIGSYIERYEHDDEDRENSKRRCVAWENTVLIQAKNRAEAYRKLIALGKCGRGVTCGGDGPKGRKGRWIFEGPTSLLPIYEPLEDGAEVLWTEWKNHSVKSIQARIRRREELEVFDDRGPR